MTSDLRPSEVAEFNWSKWALGLAQISSTTPHARSVIEKVMGDYFDNLAAREALVTAALAVVGNARPPEGHHAVVDRNLIDALREAVVGKDAHLA